MLGDEGLVVKTLQAPEQGLELSVPDVEAPGKGFFLKNKGKKEEKYEPRCLKAESIDFEMIEARFLWVAAL